MFSLHVLLTSQKEIEKYFNNYHFTCCKKNLKIKNRIANEKHIKESSQKYKGKIPTSIQPLFCSNWWYYREIEWARKIKKNKMKKPKSCFNFGTTFSVLFDRFPRELSLKITNISLVCIVCRFNIFLNLISWFSLFLLRIAKKYQKKL